MGTVGVEDVVRALGPSEQKHGDMKRSLSNKIRLKTRDIAADGAS